MRRGKGCLRGLFWGNNIPCLPKQREETTHQKRRKMIECVERKRTKAREKARESVAINYECEKSALLANFFILMCLCGVLANKYAVFCENARGITLAHYIYMYIDEQTLSFSLSFSLFQNESALISSFFVFQQNLVTIDQHLRV